MLQAGRVKLVESRGGQRGVRPLADSLFAAFRLLAFAASWLGRSELQRPPHLPLCPVQQ